MLKNALCIRPILVTGQIHVFTASDSFEVILQINGRLLADAARFGYFRPVLPLAVVIPVGRLYVDGYDCLLGCCGVFFEPGLLGFGSLLFQS